MSELVHDSAIVLEQRRIADDIYDMWIETSVAKYARAGQFINVYPKNSANILPRPISICEVEKKKIRIVYRVVGEGTLEFSKYVKNESIRIMGPLGNGFPIEEINNNQEINNIVLLGGGIGIPPMLQSMKKLKKESIAILGYRDKNTFLEDEFKEYGEVYCASEDGSIGTKGNVIDVLREKNMKPDVILSCGPMPMLRAIKDYARENNIAAYISLEERMACGVGVCLGCITKTKKKDEHSKVLNTRICTEGPVFNAVGVDI